jgi:hypothetical protein
MALNSENTNRRMHSLFPPRKTPSKGQKKGGYSFLSIGEKGIDPGLKTTWTIARPRKEQKIVTPDNALKRTLADGAQGQTSLRTRTGFQ